ncbi:putative alternative sulfate transporter protein [Botrytis fragariae]|uniref:Putative alternative sulfate transporter protein n=1 Tax=Botrytis fragariae TaxID=1964551 RepID=A0A8H6EGT8_9HELO|nr:putative alternative sulfate transporter protein [Botrytis fragariae]KAF5871787.1 putative alternative sulfate transporter protein [Botrytis fragariae]
MGPTNDITARVDSVDEDPTEKSNSELNKRLLAVEWHEDEEKQILRRLDFYLIPLVMIMFFTLNLDRGNISNALTDNMMKDLSMNQEIVNTGNSLVYVGICIGDIPANLMIQKVGADIWLPCQLLAWGLVATFQAFIKNKSGFLATRFLLGLCESGFIPGTLWYLTKWYTKRELGKRTVLFFIGSYTANLLNGLIAYGLLRLRGRAGLTGWQWLFLIDGLATLTVGIATLFLLPRDPSRGNSIIKLPLSSFTPRESEILLGRLARDNPYNTDPRDSHLSQFQIVVSVLTDWKVWAHCSMALLGLEYSPPIGTYSPSIIKSFGFGTFNSNLLVMPNSALLIITTFTLSWWSDRVNSRSIPIMFAAVWLLVGLIVLDTLPHTKSNWTFYAFLVFTGGSPSWHPLNVAWLNANQPTPRRRAIAVALYMAMTNLSAVPASHIFQASDKPYYHNGFKVLFIMAAMAISVMIAMRFAYQWLNRRIEEGKGTVEGGEVDRGFRYQL